MFSKICLFVPIVIILYYVCQSQGADVARVSAHDKLVVCYLSRWSYYRPGAGSFDINHVEPSLCTHIIYSFAGLDENSYKIKSIDPYMDLEENGGQGGFKQITALKIKHPHLKITLGIGGWNEGSAKYSKMAEEPKLRRIFINSVLHLLNQYGFDGLDLNWDYPTKRGGRNMDRKNYVTLVKELTEAFEPKGYLLTAALRSGADDMNALYDLVQLNYYLDFIHVMAYDYHGAWDGIVGPNSPIKGKSDEDHLCVEWNIQYLISKGVSPQKMILGLPMYGRTFTLNNLNEKDIEFGSTTTVTTGFAGPFSNENGFYGYNEICLAFSNKTSQWVQHWHEPSSTAYIRDGGRIISYDSPRTIANKVKLGLNYGLGGFTAWSIVTDDFRGQCDEEENTYLDYIKEHNKIAEDILFKEALRNFNEAGSKSEIYTVANNKVLFQLPKTKFSNYPLLRTINDAIVLVKEEKRVLEEMERLRDERRNEIKGKAPCMRTCTEVCFYGY